MSTLSDLTQCPVQLAKWTKRRDLLVLKARKEGHSLRTIADAAGLTHAGVAKILKRS